MLVRVNIASSIAEEESVGVVSVVVLLLLQLERAIVIITANGRIKFFILMVINNVMRCR